MLASSVTQSLWRNKGGKWHRLRTELITDKIFQRKTSSHTISRSWYLRIWLTKADLLSCWIWCWRAVAPGTVQSEIFDPRIVRTVSIQRCCSFSCQTEQWRARSRKLGALLWKPLPQWATSTWIWWDAQRWSWSFREGQASLSRRCWCHHDFADTPSEFMERWGRGDTGSEEKENEDWVMNNVSMAFLLVMKCFVWNIHWCTEKQWSWQSITLFLWASWAIIAGVMSLLSRECRFETQNCRQLSLCQRFRFRSQDY